MFIVHRHSATLPPGWCCPGRHYVGPNGPASHSPITTTPNSHVPSHPHLRHHAPRRRAIARLQHEPPRENWRSPRPWSIWASTSSRPAFRSPRPATSKRSARSPATSAARPSAAWPAATTPTSTAPGKPSSTPRKPRIHVFLATSAIHREFKLKMTRRRSSRRAVAGVKRAVGYCDDVEFSPEDAARTELDFLCQVVEAAIDAGATTVNIPDTVGYATPPHYGSVIRTLDEPRAEHRQGGDQRPLPQRPGPGRRQQPGRRRERRRADRMHDQRHRRAGRQLLARRGRDGHAHAARLLPLHDRASTRRGSCPPAGWSRRSPACRCSGTRRSSAATPSPTRRASTRTACSRSARTYEIMRPEDVGFTKTDLVLGKHSGRAAPGRPGQGPGLSPHRRAAADACSSEFKKLADKKKEIYDGDIVALIEQQFTATPPKQWKLVVATRSTAAAARSRRVTLTLAPRRREVHRDDDRRRRPDRRHLPGHREDHRHHASSAATSASRASPSAKTPRARSTSRSSTTARSTAAAASRPTPSKPAGQRVPQRRQPHRHATRRQAAPPTQRRQFGVNVTTQMSSNKAADGIGRFFAGCCRR